MFAEGGADLIEVEHLREGLDLHVRETGIHATFAIRTREQAAELVESARRRGFDVTAETSRDDADLAGARQPGRDGLTGIPTCRSVGWVS